MQGFSELLKVCDQIKRINNKSDKEVAALLRRVADYYKEDNNERL